MSETQESRLTLTTPVPELPASNPLLSPNERRGMPTWVAVGLCCCLIWLGFVIWAQVNFGSYYYALRYLGGDRLQVYPAVKSIGTHHPGEVLETTVTLRNHGSLPVKIVGGIADCSCVAYRGLPALIAPGAEVALPVTVRFGRKPGEWQQSISYVSENAREPSFRAVLVGRIADL